MFLRQELLGYPIPIPKILRFYLTGGVNITDNNYLYKNINHVKKADSI
jgi:hypothetical protein